MSVFSQRYGYSDDQGIQYECVGKRLRNRLWNHFFSVEYDADPFSRDDDSLTGIERLMDGLGLTFNIPRSLTARETNVKKLKEYVFNDMKWYLIYDLIERYVGLFDKTTQRELCKEFNEILEDECSGYRFVKGLITPITNKEEIKASKRQRTQNIPPLIRISARRWYCSPIERSMTMRIQSKRQSVLSKLCAAL